MADLKILAVIVIMTAIAKDNGRVLACSLPHSHRIGPCPAYHPSSDDGPMATPDVLNAIPSAADSSPANQAPQIPGFGSSGGPLQAISGFNPTAPFTAPSAATQAALATMLLTLLASSSGASSMVSGSSAALSGPPKPPLLFPPFVALPGLRPPPLYQPHFKHPILPPAPVIPDGPLSGMNSAALLDQLLSSISSRPTEGPVFPEPNSFVSTPPNPIGADSLAQNPYGQPPINMPQEPISTTLPSNAIPDPAPVYNSAVAPTVPAITPPSVPIAPPSIPVTPPSIPDVPPSVPIAPPSVPIAPPSVPVTPPSVPVTPPSVPVTPPSVPVTPPSAPIAPSSGPIAPPSIPVVPPSVPVDPSTAPVTPLSPPITPPSASVPSAPAAPVAEPVLGAGESYPISTPAPALPVP